MVSLITPTLLLITALTHGILAEEEVSSEKIIIHVPYKIHSHLHTHTNYKIIKVPENSIEKIEKPNGNEEQMKYLDKEIETILSGTKLPNLIKHTESQYQPQTFPVLDPEPSPVPMQGYHEFKEVEHFHPSHPSHHNHHGHPSQEESAPQQLISLPSRVPTMAPTYHTTIPDNKYSEGKSYYHAFSTKPVPFYNPPIVNPTYQVIEPKEGSHENIPHHMIAQETHERVPNHRVLQDNLERAPHHMISQESHERVPHHIISLEKLAKSKTIPKSSKEALIREYIQKPPFSMRSGKVVTGKTVKPLMTTKLYPLPTKSAKTFVIPTTRSFIAASTKKPKAIIKKNNEEYEHIGYLVVGENSQKFVTVNPNKN